MVRTVSPQILYHPLQLPLLETEGVRREEERLQNVTEDVSKKESGLRDRACERLRLAGFTPHPLSGFHSFSLTLSGQQLTLPSADLPPIEGTDNSPTAGTCDDLTNMDTIFGGVIIFIREVSELKTFSCEGVRILMLILRLSLHLLYLLL